MRIVLVSCCGPKASSPRAAKDLYRSPLFITSRLWAEERGDRWYILSAKLGLISPEKTIGWYDERLDEKSADDRRVWGSHIAAKLKAHAADEIVILAGASYCAWSSAFQNVHQPMKGIVGIGPRIAWLKADLANPQSTWRKKPAAAS